MKCTWKKFDDVTEDDYVQLLAAYRDEQQEHGKTREWGKSYYDATVELRNSVHDLKQQLKRAVLRLEEVGVKTKKYTKKKKEFNREELAVWFVVVLIALAVVEF